MDYLISDILFYVFAALALLASVLVVAFRNPVTSAMFMAVAFGMTAAVLFGLGAHFMGIIQILVYAGAIIVLFLFVVMLIDVKAEERSMRDPVVVCLGVCIAAVFAGMIANVSLALPGAFDAPCPCARACKAIDELAIGDKSAKTPPPVIASGRQGDSPSIDGNSLDRLLNDGCTRTGLGGPLPPIDQQKALVVEEVDKAWASGKAEPSQSAITEALRRGGFPDTALLGRTLFTSYNIHFVFLGLALLIGSVGAIALARRFRRND